MSWDYYADPRPDIQALIDPRGLRCLDVGCASGRLGEALKRRGAAHVTGIEVVAAVAEQAASVLDRVLTEGVLEADLPFDRDEFDLIVFADVLEHLPRPEAALDRLLPFLKPEGVVIISVPNMRFYTVLARLLFDRWSYRESGIRDRTHLRIFTRRSLLALLERSGLEVDELRRNHRLFEDQSQIGLLGEMLTRIARRTVARWIFRDLMAFQYVVRARRPA